MNELSDQELLRDYAERQSGPAFAELVRRHVDFVYSAALRMVCDSHTAEDVTQNTFIALAKNASHVRNRSVLSGWLHSTARNLAANAVRSEVRRRVREQEAAAMNELLAHEPEATWKNIAPHLDDAITDLNDSDRDALLLRYFERKSAREMGEIFGTSEDAAKKRVSRAVERLREFFSKRGVTIGAGGLMVLISANAVQAAPTALAGTISTALAGAAVHSSTAVAVTKVIVMTTLQKAMIAVTAAVLAGAGIYEARQNFKLHEQNQALRQQQSPLAEQVRQLQASLTDASNRLFASQAEISRAKTNPAETELLKLRGEVGVLRAELAEAKDSKKPPAQPPLATAREYFNRANQHHFNHDYEAELEDLNKAIELDPNMADPYLSRADLYAFDLPKERGGMEKAMPDFNRCLELKPNDASALWNRAIVYKDLRRYDDSIADWTTYIEGDTDFSHELDKTKSIAGAYFQRGNVYEMCLHDYSKAIADYTTALQTYPNLEDAHRQRGACYEHLGETEQARQDFAIEPKRN